MEQKFKHQRDFYKVKKVDTHIHHSACMDVNLLLKYIKKKAKVTDSVFHMISPFK